VHFVNEVPKVNEDAKSSEDHKSYRYCVLDGSHIIVFLKKEQDASKN
jgi:hypothetical protein